MTFPLMLVLLLILLAALGLLALGMRGRRVDDHPICRRCGFDLSGVPSGGTNCSECGSRLCEPGAYYFGRREKRRGLLVAGICLTLAAMLVGGFSIFGISIT